MGTQNDIAREIGIVTRVDFDIACEALWTEIEYQNKLTRRTADEAKDVPGFLTLGRRYSRKAEDGWADHPGNERGLDGLRKLAAIYIRGMVYCGVSRRGTEPFDGRLATVKPQKTL